MPTGHRYFVFIRAINVGSRRLTNAELIRPFQRLGFHDVAAYQAAGNVTFRTDGPGAAPPERLESELAKAYGFDPTIFVRDHDEIRSVASVRPFTDDDIAATAGRIQVSFLRSAPDDEAMANVLALVPSSDRIAFVNDHWFWLPVANVGDSDLSVRSVEDILGPMTMRTHGTITRMLARFER